MTEQAFEMITVEEFAKRMGVSRSTIFSWLEKGYLSEGQIFVRIGKTIRFIWTQETVAAISCKADSDSEFMEQCDYLKSSRGAAVNLNY